MTTALERVTVAKNASTKQAVTAMQISLYGIQMSVVNVSSVLMFLWQTALANVFTICKCCILTAPHHAEFLPERDYITLGSLLSQIRLSVSKVNAPYSGVEAFSSTLPLSAL